MATLNYDPGQAGGAISVGEVAGTFASFFAAPFITTVAGFFRGGSDRPWRGTKLSADSETGLVTRGSPLPGGKGSAALYKQEQHQLALLQETFSTGEVATGIASYYRAYAEALTQFRRDIEKSKGGTKDIQPLPGPPGDFEPPPPEEPGEPEPPGFGFGNEYPLPIDSSPFRRPHGPPISSLTLEDFPVPRFVSRFVKGIPGGAAGYNAQTLAGKLQLVGGRAMRGTTRRRRARPAAKAAAPRRRRSASGGRYNSAAWMAKIRKMRGKKGK